MFRTLAIIFVLIVLVTLGVLFWRAASTPEFSEIGVLNIDGNAEIVDASEDGALLVFTNAKRQSVGVVDLANPADPQLAGTVSVPGTPTSVAVSPDGQWALATIYKDEPVTGTAPPDQRLPGLLGVIDLRDPAFPELTAVIGIGHHPDSIALTTAGQELIAVIAIENEAVWVNGDVVVKKPDTTSIDVSEPGIVQIVRLDPAAPYSWSVSGLPLSSDLLSSALLLADTDPQPEFVAIAPARNMAAVTLQENNGIALVDLAKPEIITAFSTGAVLDRPADLRADNVVEFAQQYPADAIDQPLAGMRFPDGIAFSPDGQYLLSADEGEDALTGGRGFSIWSLTGELVWSDDGQTEQQAAAADFYPDRESAKRGIEIEGISAARFGSRDFAFVVSEEGDFLAIYDISNAAAPEFIQLLSTGRKPESVKAIPSRNLVAVAAEGTGNISIYEFVGADE